MGDGGGGGGRCMVGSCVNLLSERIGVMLLLITPVLHHVWYCSA